MNPHQLTSTPSPLLRVPVQDSSGLSSLSLFLCVFWARLVEIGRCRPHEIVQTTHSLETLNLSLSPSVCTFLLGFLRPVFVLFFCPLVVVLMLLPSCFTQFCTK